MQRRGFIAGMLVTLGSAGVLGAAVSEAQVPLRRRRRIRRRIRRRMRRRVVTRMVLGRPFWVVPVGLAVGWELMHEHRVVVVKEIRVVERDGKKVEVAMVHDADGKTEQVDILREDTADNRKNLQGSILPDDDRSTPAVEDEIEVETDA